MLSNNIVFIILFIFVVAEAIKHYGYRLTDYEKQEIEKYPEIWYLGLDSCKKVTEDCFDDENGSYNKVPSFINTCFTHLRRIGD